MAVNGKKKKKKKDNYKNGSREVENEISKLSLPYTEKKQSCLLVHSLHFKLTELIFLKQIFI